MKDTIKKGNGFKMSETPDRARSHFTPHPFKRPQLGVGQAAPGSGNGDSWTGYRWWPAAGKTPDSDSMTACGHDHRFHSP